MNKKTISFSDNLISLKLHGKKLDVQAMANNVVNELRDYGIQHFKRWIYFNMYRAVNNGVAIKILQSKKYQNPHTAHAILTQSIYEVKSLVILAR